MTRSRIASWAALLLFAAAIALSAAGFPFWLAVLAAAWTARLLSGRWRKAEKRALERSGFTPLEIVALDGDMSLDVLLDAAPPPRRELPR